MLAITLLTYRCLKGNSFNKALYEVNFWSHDDDDDDAKSEAAKGPQFILCGAWIHDQQSHVYILWRPWISLPGLFAIHLIWAVNILPQNEISSTYCYYWKTQEISGIYPMRTITVWTKFHGNPPKAPKATTGKPDMQGTSQNSDLSENVL